MSYMVTTTFECYRENGDMMTPQCQEATPCTDLRLESTQTWLSNAAVAYSTCNRSRSVQRMRPTGRLSPYCGPIQRIASIPWRSEASEDFVQ